MALPTVNVEGLATYGTKYLDKWLTAQDQAIKDLEEDARNARIKLEDIEGKLAYHKAFRESLQTAYDAAHESEAIASAERR
jgi:hypothetical protein